MAKSAMQLGKAFVKVIGVRRERFVEFEFQLNDEDLSVELIMPLTEFHEFCAAQGATVLPPSADAQAAFERLQWRNRMPHAGTTDSREELS